MASKSSQVPNSAERIKAILISNFVCAFPEAINPLLRVPSA